MPLLNSRQIKALRKLRLWPRSWELAANFPSIGELTWTQLMELRYVEDRHEGSSRYLRLTEEGRRVVDQADQR